MARKNYESANLRFAKNALPPHSALLIECRFVQLKTLCQRSAGLAWHNISWVKVNFEGAFFFIKVSLIIFYTIYHIRNASSRKKECSSRMGLNPLQQKVVGKYSNRPQWGCISFDKFLTMHCNSASFNTL